MRDTIEPDIDAPAPATSITFSVRITSDKDPRGPRGTIIPVTEPIGLPTDYAILHDLSLASHVAKLGQHRHVGAAAMALCLPALGRMLQRQTPPIDYEATGYNVIKYGRAVYSWLVARGAHPNEPGEALKALSPLILAAGFPPDETVIAALGKSPGPGE